MAVIGCVDVDPFLVNLVRRLRPDDTVEEVAAEDVTSGRPRRYGALVVEGQSPAVDALHDPRLARRTILVVQEGARTPPSHPGPVLRRPVEVTDLRVALASIVPTGRMGRLAAWMRGLPAATSVEGVFGVARVASVAAASGLALATAPGGPPLPFVALLFAWTLVRVWVREQRPLLVSLDIVSAAVAIALVPGGPTSPFMLYAAVVAAGVGYAFPSRIGASVVGVATLIGLVPIVREILDEEATAEALVAWGVMLPLASVIGVMTARIRDGREGDNVALLRELNATLARLSKQTQGAAGTLDATSVLTQLVASLREDVGARAGLVLLGSGEVHDVAVSFGLADEPPARVLAPSGRRVRLPETLEPLFPDGTLELVPLRTSGVHEGLLVASLPDDANLDACRQALARLAEEAVLALSNARLFAGIRELTIDEERRRIARDLHDGVIQSLVHLRLELELVAHMTEDEGQAKDLGRLRDVVGQAVEEVRGTVNDLRSVRLSAGLGTALTGLARELERPGLRFVVDAGPTQDLTPEGALQLLRIAQEAISNAIHHGESSVVYVRLWQDDEHVHLQVLDNGSGLEPVTVPAGRGVGLRAMQERADLIGATLDLGPGADGGTCVQVDVPLGGTRS